MEGIVQYGNEKLQFAMIHVVGNGQVAIGRIGEDGRYKVENCPLGEVKIGINTKGAFGEYQSKVLQGGAYKGPEAKGRGAVALKFIDVPERYADPDKSGITTTVTVGVNTFDIIIPAR
ncbi:MAG: hypothetical protein RMJ19_07260 [Gemmatales bacterium]|nr:hypothetical protein [Gemmatales bacterium]MDW8175453.1 hypothetical protein [Gemmatales bacterium]